MNKPSAEGRPFDAAEMARKRTLEHVERAAAAQKARQASLSTASALTSCGACGRIVVARKRCGKCGASIVGLPPLQIAMKAFGRRKHRRGSAI